MPSSSKTRRRRRRSGHRPTFHTALDAARRTYKRTGNLLRARLAMKRQALANARRLFSSVSLSH